MRESIVEKNDSQAQFFVDSVDSQIAAAEELVHSLLFDRRLSYLIYPNDILNEYELMQGYLSQQERIKHLMLSSPLIESSVIYLPNREQKITDTYIGEMEESDLEIVKNLYKSATKTMTYENGNLYIVTSGFYYSAGNPIPDILFVVTFSVDKIISNLENYNIYPGGVSLFELEKNKIIQGGGAKLNILELLNGVPNKENLIETGEKFNQNMKFNRSKYRLLAIPSRYLGTFFQFIPTNEFFDSVNHSYLMLIIYLFSMLIITFYISRYLNNHVHKPLNILVNLFRNVENGDLDVNPIPLGDKGREFNYVFNSFNHMKIHLKTLIDEVYVQKNLVQRSELKQLQSQINPHFLYNSFFSLNRKLKREDTESAAKLAEHLGIYFQFLTRTGEDIVSLEEEILHAKSYTSVQQIRFYDRIQVEYKELPASYRTKAVPRLILQPIIENAFKYGLENLEEEGKLVISFVEKKKELIVCIEDNGEDLTDDILIKLQEQLNDTKVIEVTGVVNIHRRLKIYFGEKSGLTLSRSEMGGLKVNIYLPFA